MAVTAVGESVDPAEGPRGASPCYITSGKARRKVVMGYDVAGHNGRKDHPMIEIRVGVVGIFR